MSADRDADRIVRSWLEEGVTTLPDRVLDAVLDELPATPQRRITWWPARRLPEMNNIVKLSVAAAVVVVALLGLNYLVAPNVGDPGLDDASPTPSSTAAALQPGPLDPGRYVMDDPTRTSVPFAFTVPAGWTTRAGDFALFKHEDEPGGVGIFSFIVTHVYADACESAGTLTEVGPTVDDLADALANQAGSEAAAPVDLTIGGYAGVRIDMSPEAGLDGASCRHPDLLQIWANEAETDFLAFGTDTLGSAPVYVIDVEGERVVLTAGGDTDASAADLAEIDAIIDSITFEP